MLHCYDYLSDKQSKMLLQVHDELLFEVALAEKSIVWDLKEIMEKVYPYKYLPLTCSVEWSEKSWQDKQELLN